MICFLVFTYEHVIVYPDLVEHTFSVTLGIMPVIFYNNVVVGLMY